MASNYFELTGNIVDFTRAHCTLVLSAVAGGIGLYFLRKYCAGGVCRSPARLDGKTVIITGANTGIGKETARDLAARGARVILACRDLTKAETAASEIRKSTGNGNVVIEQLDLASLASVRTFATIINEREPKVNILINNAGVAACPQWKTEDGFELQFGTNHLGHFLLTNLLLDKLKNSAPSRVVIVSALAHVWGKIDFDDINSETSYSPIGSYCQSKLANVLFMRELARRLEGTGVTVNALHPGVMHTEIGRHFFTTFGWAALPMIPFAAVYYLFWKSVKQGAQTTIHLAVDRELETTSGLYFSDCLPCDVSPLAKDEATARRLWRLSEEMVGLKEDLTKAETAASVIRKSTGNGNVVIEQLDLASLASVRTFATIINEREPKVNILINNAGVGATPKWVTEDGFVLQFGTNHLGHFLLTNLLLDKLKNSAPSRVVIVSSVMHEWGKIDFDDISYEKSYSPIGSYCQSKLANVLFMRELARRLKGTGVTVNALHPGWTRTELARHLATTFGWASLPMVPVAAIFCYMFWKNAKQGAQTTIHLVVDKELETTSGMYFSDCLPCDVSPLAKDEATARRLWRLSEEMVGLTE
ncbi:PREDICTED: retinol dehydrogenase 13-like [Branchiostoma belcheri]|uniref:Retinol dehydrogenase 13-like n=1 Tax=Branchiostoma belcheri TaxID=7741 RepID=A0A6P5AY11_BRABE|nr:PREDICTED: retinol dehydrogenase 13-like [Branchiostoma belcheri]